MAVFDMPGLGLGSGFVQVTQNLKIQVLETSSHYGMVNVALFNTLQYIYAMLNYMCYVEIYMQYFSNICAMFKYICNIL